MFRNNPPPGLFMPRLPLIVDRSISSLGVALFTKLVTAAYRPAPPKKEPPLPLIVLRDTDRLAYSPLFHQMPPPRAPARFPLITLSCTLAEAFSSDRPPP